MRLSIAPKEELIQIAQSDSCSLDLRYAAARELQFRLKRKINGMKDQIWWSLHRDIKNDIERLRHRILQLRDEMVANGVPDWQARYFLDMKTINRLNRKLFNTSAGKARKHVNRKAVAP